MSEKFSYSKISTFSNCPYSFYLNYIKYPKPYNEQNVYGELGGTCHECIEKMIKGTMNDQQAIRKLNDDLLDCELLDMKFPSFKGDKELVKNNYIAALTHYFDNFELFCDNPDHYAIEEYFEHEIEGTLFRGYIDYYYIIGNDLYCIDFKTSSKFSKKELEKKKLQLIIYGMYLKNKYPDKNIYCYFDMLKYIKGKRGGLKERHKLDFLETGERGFIEILFNQDNIEQLKDYVRETILEINSLSREDENDWNPLEKCTKSYFCKTLCGFKKTCKHFNEMQLTDK